jgi:hypothetical protein
MAAVTRNASPYNASRVRRRLPARLLTTPVAMLKLSTWRDGLRRTKMAPAPRQHRSSSQ